MLNFGLHLHALSVFFGTFLFMFLAAHMLIVDLEAEKVPWYQITSRYLMTKDIAVIMFCSAILQTGLWIYYGPI